MPEQRSHMKEAVIRDDDGNEWDVELSGPAGRRDPLAAAVVTFTRSGEDTEVMTEVAFDLTDLRRLVRAFSLRDAVGARRSAS